MFSFIFEKSVQLFCCQETFPALAFLSDCFCRSPPWHALHPPFHLAKPTCCPMQKWTLCFGGRGSPRTTCGSEDPRPKIQGSRLIILRCSGFQAIPVVFNPNPTQQPLPEPFLWAELRCGGKEADARAQLRGHDATPNC